MKTIAVFDLGSARTKITIADICDSSIKFRSLSCDTFFAAESQTNGSKLALQALSEFAATSGGLNCDRRVSVATEYFRANGRDSELLRRIEELLGPVNILEPGLEARIFYLGVLSSLSSPRAFAALDVGGGSVQVCWGSEDREWRSMPIGTFALEKQFQPDEERRVSLDEKSSTLMQAYVDGQVTAALPATLERDTIVVGSNVMLDFFTSALKSLGYEWEESDGVRLISRTTIERLQDSIRSRPYSSLGALFPENPRFMHGADKLIIVVLSVMRQLNATSIIPTNESVSRSLARLTAGGTPELTALGLEVVTR